MKLTSPIATEIIDKVATEISEAVEETTPEPKFVPLSLDEYIARERNVVLAPMTNEDRDTMIKWCEVIDESEFELAEELRSHKHANEKGAGTYEAYCYQHPIEEFMPQIPKKKRYVYHAYSESPVEQFIYEFAFKWGAYTLRKVLRYSGGDTRIAKVYCNMLRNDYFTSHSQEVQDIVQEILCEMFIQIRTRAKADGEHKLKTENEYGEQYIFTKADLVGYRKNDKTKENSVAIVRCTFQHFADETDTETVDVEYDLNSQYQIFKACQSIAMAWIERNQAYLGNYNRHGKKRISLQGWAEDTCGDYRQEREMIRAEGSLDWLARRKEILDAIAKVKPAGELRAYRAVLDLLHDGVLDFDSHETLSPWQTDMIILAISGEERKVKSQIKKLDHEKYGIPQEDVRKYNTLGVTVKKFVQYDKVGKGKCVAKNSARIEYRDTERNKVVLELLTIKNTLFAYCRAFANEE